MVSLFIIVTRGFWDGHLEGRLVKLCAGFAFLFWMILVPAEMWEIDFYWEMYIVWCETERFWCLCDSFGICSVKLELCWKIGIKIHNCFHTSPVGYLYLETFFFLAVGWEGRQEPGPGGCGGRKGGPWVLLSLEPPLVSPSCLMRCCWASSFAFHAATLSQICRGVQHFLS